MSGVRPSRSQRAQEGLVYCKNSREQPGGCPACRGQEVSRSGMSLELWLSLLHVWASLSFPLGNNIRLAFSSWNMYGVGQLSIPHPGIAAEESLLPLPTFQA